MAPVMKKVNKTLKRKIIRISLALSFFIIGTIIGINIFQSRKKELAAEKFEVKRGTVSQDLVLSGQIKAEEDAKLFFPTSGKLAWIGVKEGDLVRKGQALASLDKTPLAAAYQQALNNIRLYEANLEATYDSLQGKDTTETFAQKATRTSSEVAKDNAYDALRIAKYNLDNATLIAPFSGIVTYVAHPYPLVNIPVGELQVEIINPETIYFEATADQDEIIKIKKDENVEIVLDSFPDKKIVGKISFVSLTPSIEEQGAVYKIKVKLENKEELKDTVKIGMTGDLRISLAKKENVLYAPSAFIKADNKGKYVHVGSIKNKTYIKTGLEGEEFTEIEEGLKEGEILYD